MAKGEKLTPVADTGKAGLVPYPLLPPVPHMSTVVPYPSQVGEAVQGGDTRPLANQFLSPVNLLNFVRA